MSRKEFYEAGQIGLTWARLQRKDGAQEILRLHRVERARDRGRLKLKHVALLIGLLAAGVAISPADPSVVDFVRDQVDTIIAKDSEVFRQTSQMYKTPEFKASIDRNLGK